MIELLTDPNMWASFLTLTMLEIVLGIDNLVFLSIISQRLPKAQQPKARFIGLALALGMRIGLLFSITWIAGLVDPVFHVGEHAVSWRDIILGVGGLFLLYKGTTEIHHSMEDTEEEFFGADKKASFGWVIAQIMVLDLVFSLDSIITAVALTDELPIMVAAICIAIVIMLVASEPTSAFISKHPTVKMLALSFIILVGFVLVADAMHFHMPRGYLYFAMAFSLGVETLNLIAADRREKKKKKKKKS